MAKNYKLTTIGCFMGIFTQAIITNLTPILFVPMMSLYGFDYKQLGLLVAVNFITQVTVDIAFSRTIDKIGYRRITLPTCLISFIGLLLFAAAPILFRGNEFAGIMLATVVFAASSGFLEILVSPIVAAIPSDNKETAMSLMHSFYAWGQAATIVVTTLCIFVFGKENWQWIVLTWAAVPLASFFVFYFSPMPETVAEEKRQGMKALIFKPFYILCLLAIFGGAGTELVMSQWSSAFMEKGLEMPKLWGDLLGMCGFAVMLGLGRTIYGIMGEKININRICALCSGLAIVCYLAAALSPVAIVSVIACALCGIAASLLWPGTIVIAAMKFPFAGAWMFAILAAAGDIGGATAPWITGQIIDGVQKSGFMNMSEQSAIRAGILAAAVFPIIALISHILIIKRKNRERPE